MKEEIKNVIAVVTARERRRLEDVIEEWRDNSTDLRYMSGGEAVECILALLREE